MNEQSVKLPPLSAREKAIRCAELAVDKKGYDIKVLDITQISTISDYLVLISGQSDKQNQAICEHIRKEMKKHGKGLSIEGEDDGRWIVMDYLDLLVHIFHEEQRKLYDLDSLWSKADLVQLPDGLMTSSTANKVALSNQI